LYQKWRRGEEGHLLKIGGKGKKGLIVFDRFTYSRPNILARREETRFAGIEKREGLGGRKREESLKGIA